MILWYKILFNKMMKIKKKNNKLNKMMIRLQMKINWNYNFF